MPDLTIDPLAPDPSRPPRTWQLRGTWRLAPGRLPLPGRPASVAGRLSLVGANLAAVALFLLSYAHGVSFGRYRIDLDVYRIGSQVWLHGRNLYGVLPLTGSGVRLPFSYPPIAAVLLSPLSLVPMAVAGTALTLVTVALTALVLRVFLRSVAGPQPGTWWTLAWLLPVALLLEPTWNTLNYGQVNVALMAVVAFDCLAPAPRWPRGALVGLAAAVKLTPAAFILFFLVRRDWRAAGTAVIAFAASTGAGFLFAWHDSVRYWTTDIFQMNRPGDPAFGPNQSIAGVLARAGVDPRTPGGTAFWLGLSAVVVIAACVGMRHAVARSADAWALSLNAFAALLVSPISWSHHWVWAAPALLSLALLGYRYGRRGWLLAAACGLVVFAAAPQWWFQSDNDHWSAWEQAIGSAYVWFGVAAVVLSAIGALRAVRDRAAAAQAPGAVADGTEAVRTPDEVMDEAEAAAGA